MLRYATSSNNFSTLNNSNISYSYPISFRTERDPYEQFKLRIIKDKCIKSDLFLKNYFKFNFAKNDVSNIINNTNNNSTNINYNNNSINNEQKNNLSVDNNRIHLFLTEKKVRKNNQL